MQDHLKKRRYLDLQQELTTIKNKQGQLWMERTRMTLELRISINGTYILKKNRIQAINNELETIEDDIETVIEKIDKIDL